MKGSASALVNTEFTKDHTLEEQNHNRNQNEVQVSSYQQSAKSGRDELYLFYESTSASDNPEHLLGINGSSIEASRWEKNNFPITAGNSAPKMLQEDYYQASGFGGHGLVASHAGGSFHEGKDTRNVRRNLRSETKGPSLRYDRQKVDLPDVCAPQVDKKHNLPRYMSSYNRLLKSGRLSKCVELLEDMGSKDILDMNKIYHSKFFDFCRRQKASKEAFRFAKLIRNPTLSTFNMLMSVCAAAQDSEGAFEVWHLVQKAGYKPDCRLYTTLISTCAKSGKVDTMFEVFHEMVNAGVEPNIHTYGALIDGCARAGQVAKAFGVYGILRSKNLKPDRVVFNALIRACGQSGAVERAFDVLAEMRSEVQPIDPDHITVGALIRACTSAGQVDRVKGVYDMMDQFNIKGTPELYTIAANSCSQTGDWDFACKIFADMKRKGVIPDEMFFSALVDVAGHAGNLDAAFEVLQDARTEGMNPGSITYSSLMGACSNTRNWEKALELFEHIKAKGLNPTISTVNALITALCDADQMQKALDVLTEMQKLRLRPNDVTYSILIAASEKNDDLDVGLTLYSQAKADGVSLSRIMCKCLIKMCSRRFEKASTIGEPVFSLKSGRPQIDNKWASWL
ncbi:Pentatricopeptide repeat-containing protein MRL1 chloroplastic [Bienertia sinuspersici]